MRAKSFRIKDTFETKFSQYKNERSPDRCGAEPSYQLLENLPGFCELLEDKGGGQIVFHNYEGEL